jgi:hypothetical protein
MAAAPVSAGEMARSEFNVMAGSGGRSGLLYAIGAAFCMAVAVAVGVRLIPQAGVGDVDPVSAVVALAALAAALLSARQSMRALQSTYPSAVEVAARLAIEVQRREGQARTQLLGGRGRTIDVDFDFRSAPAHDARRAEPVGRLEDVVAYYETLHPRRLVITGAPGAGKTVLALELVLGLLAVRGPGDAVPVRVSAAAWDTERPVRGWLVEHLIEAYRLPRLLAEALLDAGLILPVIDGLDEMDADQTPGYASRAARAIQALNVYQHGRDAAPLVLTCRSGQYQALRVVQVWAHDAARVEIRAVDSVKAAQFIRSRVDDVTRWQPVLNTITNHPGGTLAIGLSTPWRLTLATTVYEQRKPENGTYLRDPVTLTKLSAASPEAVRDHLLEHFIPAVIAAHNAAAEHPEQPYSDQQVHQWLRVLASYLDHNARTGRTLGGVPLSGTDLVLHQLWPLAGVNRVRTMILAAFALIWLIASPFLLTYIDIGFSARQIISASGPIFGSAFFAYWLWSELWPTPVHVNIQKLRTKKGRRQFAGELALGLGLGLTGGLAFGLVVGLTFGFALALALALGLGLGIAFGLGDRLGDDATTAPWDPREIVKLDLISGLAFGLALAFGVALASGIALANGATFGLLIGLMVGLTFALWRGLAGTRYVAFILCTRRPFTAQPLPWRLGRFLNWCYQAGLIRQAGISYQFRHRELQHYLAHSQAQSVPTTIHQ